MTVNREMTVNHEMTAAGAGTAAPGTLDARPAWLVRPIDPGVLAQLRVRDDAGRPPRMLTDEEGGAPLRCCLRRITPGERVALVSYAPLRRWARQTGADPGPYDETGPVFIHPGPCDGPTGTGYPAALAGTPCVLRSYSHDGRILGGRPFGLGGPGGARAAEAVLTEILAEPSVAFVHVRALTFGCFIFEVRRD